MSKKFESKIPKPVPSRTGSVRSNESTTSNSDKRSHVQFNPDTLSFSELRIKLVGEETALNKAGKGRSKSRGTANSNSSSRTRRSSKSPVQQKYKILLYEPEKPRSSNTISPYMCDISNRMKEKDDSNASYKEIFVTDREYKLLKGAADMQKEAERKAGRRFEKTLFGYVSGPEAAALASAGNESLSKKSVSNTKQSSSQLASSASRSRKTSSQAEVARKAEDQKRSKSQRETGSRRTICNKTQSSESTNKIEKRQSRQSTSKTDNYTLTTAWDDDLQEIELKSEEYRSFIAKFKDRFNRPYFADSAGSPIYPPAPVLVEKSSQESQTLKERNANMDKDLTCDLLVEQHAQGTCNEPDSLHRKYSSSGMDSLCDELKDLCQNISHNEQPTLGERMKRSVMVASEASLVLMNTLFKDALHDPQSSARLVDCSLFQKFINVETEVEALEKAANIFESANKSIVGYLNSLRHSSMNNIPYVPEESLDFGNISEIPIVKSEAKDLKDGSIAAKHSTGSTNTSIFVDTAEVMSSKKISNMSCSNMTDVDVSVSTDRVTQQWSYMNFPSNGRKPLQMKMSTAPDPGFLEQTIHINDMEFHLNFVGNTRKVSSLISSSRSRNKIIALTPFQLLDIIDRCLTHLAVRLSSTNHRFQSCSQSLGAVVKDYTDGRHGHYSKSLKRSNVKLQGLNTFAGIVFQLTRVLTKISEKLLCAMKILLKLSDILKDSERHIIPEDGETIVLPFESLVDIVTILDDVENALEIGKNSLTAIYSKSASEVKLKKCLREILEDVFQALLEMDTKDYIDFGSLLMSAVSSAGMLIACKEIPKFDATLRGNVLSKLNKINIDIQELQSTSKIMNFVAGYLASKSLLNLKNNRDVARLMEEKQSQLRSIPWYKRRTINKVVKRTYSIISIPSPLPGVSGELEELQLNQTAATTDSSQYSTVSAENEILSPSTNA